jgi:hypothetical protein
MPPMYVNDGILYAKRKSSQNANFVRLSLAGGRPSKVCHRVTYTHPAAHPAAPHALPACPGLPAAASPHAPGSTPPYQLNRSCKAPGAAARSPPGSRPRSASPPSISRKPTMEIGADFPANCSKSFSVSQTSFWTTRRAASLVSRPSNLMYTSSALLPRVLSMNQGSISSRFSSMKMVFSPLRLVFLPRRCCRTNSPCRPKTATNLPILR